MPFEPGTKRLRHTAQRRCLRRPPKVCEELSASKLASPPPKRWPERDRRRTDLLPPSKLSANRSVAFRVSPTTEREHDGDGGVATPGHDDVLGHDLTHTPAVRALEPPKHELVLALRVAKSERPLELTSTQPMAVQPASAVRKTSLSTARAVRRPQGIGTANALWREKLDGARKTDTLGCALASGQGCSEQGGDGARNTSPPPASAD